MVSRQAIGRPGTASFSEGLNATSPIPSWVLGINGISRGVGVDRRLMKLYDYSFEPESLSGPSRALVDGDVKPASQRQPHKNKISVRIHAQYGN